MRPFLALALLLFAAAAQSHPPRAEGAIGGVASEGAATSSTAKITHGFIDGDDHPQVGALAGPGNRGHNYAHCTTPAIGPRTLLTAAHCRTTKESSERVVVSFEPLLEDIPGHWPTIWYQVKDGGGYASGLWGGTFYPDPSGLDLAVIVLDQRAPWPAHGGPTLPRLNQLDTEHATFTAVGYGKTDESQDQNETAKVRRWTTERYHSRGDTKFTAEKMAGQGITCSGDSGGPAFYGTSNIIAGIVSEGDCESEAVYVRLDTARAREFLGRFVGTP